MVYKKSRGILESSFLNLFLFYPVGSIIIIIIINLFYYYYFIYFIIFFYSCIFLHSVIYFISSLK